MRMQSKRYGGPRAGRLPSFRELRQKLRNKIEDSFNIIALMLVGRSREAQKGKQWSIDMDVVSAVLELAQESQRFQSWRTNRSQSRGRR